MFRKVSLYVIVARFEQNWLKIYNEFLKS